MPAGGAIEYHAGLAREWEAKYAARRSFRARHRVLGALLADAVRPGAKWLDAGCGTGHFSRELARLGARVTGVDGAASMIEAARAYDASVASDIAYRVTGDLARLQEPDGAFDGILCSSVLEYLAEPNAALAEFRRVTRPGGALVVTLPNARALIRAAHSVQFAVTRATRSQPTPEYLAYVKHMWSPRAAGELVAAAGYAVQSLRPGGLGLGPAWLDRQPLWGPLLFVTARRA
jgi:2-polyprenyl-6-hydroxyphenyl methylase/3-demethylubiquinone-9 3-methyltransferase